MKYVIKSFRHGEVTLRNVPEYKQLWEELLEAIRSISDEEIIECHENAHSKQKSISMALNDVIEKKLVSIGWNSESPIFQNNEFTGAYWRLDFAKNDIAVEVAFNHAGVIAWNLVKLVLSGELNHVEKAIDTKVGVIICATKELKSKGGFDTAIGEFEKFLTYLKPLNNILTTPIAIIGLKAPKTFYIDVKKIEGKNIGFVRRL